MTRIIFRKQTRSHYDDLSGLYLLRLHPFCDKIAQKNMKQNFLPLAYQISFAKYIVVAQIFSVLLS